MTDRNDNPGRNPFIQVASGSSASFDEAEVRRALALMIDPDASHELRAVPSGRVRLVRGDRLDDAVKAVADLADDKGVYLTINPVDAAVVVERHRERKAARNRDILSRRRLYIDVDPVRGQGVNATDAERSAARSVAEAVLAELDAAGWPRPLMVDSGSGWHLHYLVDLPNDELTRQVVARFIKALKARHDTPLAHVDRSIHNASRIARLPGTWNRKGPRNTEDRPYRLCRLVSIPQAFTIVSFEQLRDAAGISSADAADLGPRRDPSRSPVSALNPWIQKADDGSDSYARSALEREVGKVATAADMRNNTLHIAAVSLGTLVGAGRLDESEVRDKLSRAAVAAGLGTDGDPTEIGRAIDNGLEYGKQHPRDEKGKGKSSKASATTAESVGATTDAATGKRSYPFPLIIRGSDITPKKVEWIWPDRIPIGFLTLFAGRTAVGKSFVTLDFAARITVGEELPFCGGVCGDVSNVLIISEDSAEYVIAPRLIELGADMGRVAVMTFEAMAQFTLSNIDMLDDLYEESSRPRLVIIDPPTNFLGQKDEHRNAEVRGVLMGLSIWAMKYDLACVLITHCNKGIKKDIAALDRIIGSVAWASTSRVAHILAPDPDDLTRCLFIPMKNNVGEVAKGLAYRVRKTETLAVVDWLEQVDITGDEALGALARPRRVVAAEWLVERFKERLEWPSDELFRAGQAAGVSRNAIFEAKDSLQLPKARHDITEDGRNEWVWWVPPDWPPLSR